MGRQILAPSKMGLEKLFPGKNFEAIAPQKLRVLDIACGTGRTLKFIRATFPKAALSGVDLSPNYLKKKLINYYLKSRGNYFNFGKEMQIINLFEITTSLTNQDFSLLTSP